LFYANAVNVKERLLLLVRERDPKPKAVVLDLADSADLDVETLDTLGELAETLAADNVELRLALVRSRALALLERAGITDKVPVAPTIDAAVSSQPGEVESFNPRSQSGAGRPRKGVEP
jgi:MFS superfamily sulfate permease-like transporter